jgi:transposase
MSHIEGIAKNQYTMLPPVLDDWLPIKHRARTVEMFVESLELKELGMVEKNEKTGRPSYAPKEMLKILLYGYMEGERSSRKIESETYDDIGYRWLSRDLHPDYRSIIRFRTDNWKWIEKLLKKTLELYETSGGKIDGVAFTDGTKIYASANDNKVITKERIQRLEKAAKKILEEAKKTDKAEDELQGERNENFLNKDKLKDLEKEIEKYKEELKESGKKALSLTDKEANFMRHSQGHGTHLSYNGQLSTDGNGLILAADMVDKPTDDGKMLKENLRQAEENIGKKIETIVADKGYYETNAVKEIIEGGHKCVVAKQRNAAKGEMKFEYKKDDDTYECEKKKKLKYIQLRIEKGKNYKVYAADGKECNSCEFCNKCCKGNGKGKYGRRIMIYEDQEFIAKYEKELEGNKDLYDKRKTVIEPTIGTIKTRHRFRRLLLRGLKKAKIEWMLVATGFNLLKIWGLKVRKA